MGQDVHSKRPPRPAAEARAPGRQLGDRARSRERVHVRCLMARRCGWTGRRVEALDADRPFGTCPRCGAPVVARRSRGGGRWRATDLSRREELYLSRRLQESLQAWDGLSPDERPARRQAVARDVVADALEVTRYLQAWLDRQEDR